MNSANSMPYNQEILNSLRRLGLNQYETRAYYTLNALGTSTAGELSEKAELPRPRVYDVLTSLQDKGFVALQPGRPVRYASLPLSEAIKTLKKQKEQALLEEIAAMEKISSELSAKMKNTKVAEKFNIDENVWTLKGRDAIYSKIGSMLGAAKNHIIISSSTEGVARKFAAYSAEIEKARSKGVKIKVVSKNVPKNIASKVHLHERELPTRFVVADDQALIFLTDEQTPAEEEVGVWMQSPHLSATLKSLVEGN
ncbi:MAG: TrmB family transcriptional regulator [Candidatus Micrarchaeia archaeon]